MRGGADRRGLQTVRRFVLVRSEDVSGVSGIGEVAQGVLFDTGKVVIAWTRTPSSIDIYDSVADLLAIHGHVGRTRIRWLDDEARNPGAAHD
jgi:hypothetical protein